MYVPGVQILRKFFFCVNDIYYFLNYFLKSWLSTTTETFPIEYIFIFSWIQVKDRQRHILLLQIAEISTQPRMYTFQNHSIEGEPPEMT